MSLSTDKHAMENSKRLSYLVGEDFYFLTYSLLILLNESSQRENFIFRDHRKLPHLIQFASDDRLISILSRNQGRQIQNPVDRELLLTAYTRAEMHKHEMRKILFALEKRNLVALSRAKETEALDVHWSKEHAPTELISSVHFADDVHRCKSLRKLIPRYQVMSYSTLIDRAYVTKGLRLWAV